VIILNHSTIPKMAASVRGTPTYTPLKFDLEKIPAKGAAVTFRFGECFIGYTSWGKKVEQGRIQRNTEGTLVLLHEKKELDTFGHYDENLKAYAHEDGDEHVVQILKPCAQPAAKAKGVPKKAATKAPKEEKGRSAYGLFAEAKREKHDGNLNTSLQKERLTKKIRAEWAEHVEKESAVWKKYTDLAKKTGVKKPGPKKQEKKHDTHHGKMVCKNGKCYKLAETESSSECDHSECGGYYYYYYSELESDGEGEEDGEGVEEIKVVM
jgi:hypothetical protein